MCWMKNRENLGLLFVMTINDSVYSVSIGNSPGWLKVFSSMLIDVDESRSLIAVKSLRCFTGIFTVLSESELPNLMVTGVVYRLFTNLTSAACAIRRSRLSSRTWGAVCRLL